MTPVKLACPRCPMCGTRPTLIVSLEQAFCEVGSCPTFCWDMTRTSAENRTNITVHDLDLPRGWDGE